MYLELIKKLPRPTKAQTMFFISMFSNDHSWYKHLPSKRTVDFVFYLDPNAGRCLKKITKDTLNDRDIFEFKSLDADREARDYQRMYGLWSYYSTNYTANFIPNDDGSIRDSRPYIGLNYVNEAGIIEPLPTEVIEKGTIKLSCYIHSNCFKNSTEFWDKDEPTKTDGQKHKEIMEDLFNHLNGVLDYLYGA